MMNWIYNRHNRFMLAIIRLIILNCIVLNTVYAQLNEEYIKHVIYSQRLMFRGHFFLKNMDVKNENLRNEYVKIYPEYGEYYWISLHKIDTIKLEGFLTYEYRISERCYSQSDSTANEIQKSDPELHFSDGIFKKCQCCNLTGNVFKDRVIGLENDCINTKGIILVDTLYSVKTPLVYFVSGNCVFIDEIEKTYFKNNDYNVQNISTLLKLKYWNSDIYKVGSKIENIEKLRKRKYRIYFYSSSGPSTLRIKRSFSLVLK